MTALAPSLRLTLEWTSTLHRRDWPTPPDGGGRPALLIPGFLAGDASMARLGAWLRAGGFITGSSGMQVNVDCMEPSVAAIERRLEVLTKRTGQRALVVGQSRGGTFGRVLAARRPELVETLVTLGSPVLDQLAFRTPAGRIPAYLLAMLGTVGLPGLIGWSCLNGDCCARSRGELAEDLSPDVRYVAFYSRRDDVVRWEACLDHRAELVEVSSSHLGMGVERKVWCAMAERFSLEGADR